MSTLSGLTYYPIKACRGFDVDSWQVERMGLESDRRMMVVTPAGGFLTQREHPRLAWVTPKLKDSQLELSAPDFDSIHLTVRKSGNACSVNIWKSRDVQAIDQGDDAAQWFSDWLGRPVRLVHIADGFKRRLNPEYAVTPDDHTGFADGYPILLISEGSLADLNARLEQPLQMNRFRPNLAVKGCDLFSEDTWKRIRIGDLELAVVKPCPRCVVTTIDKKTLETGGEPLKTLNAFRKQTGGAMFGQNVIPLNEGRLAVGMSVQVID
jgi:uncharacterized protein YcbX